MHHAKVSLACLGLFVSLGSTAHAATTVHLADDMNSYADNTALRTAWNNSGMFLGTNANPGASNLPAGEKFLASNNVVGFRALTDDVSVADNFTVTFKISQTNTAFGAARAQVLWLVDYNETDTLNRGYGIRVDFTGTNNRATSTTGTARVIRSGSATDESAGVVISGGSSSSGPPIVTRTGISLSSTASNVFTVPSATESVDIPFYDVKLTWSAQTKTFDLFVVDMVTPKTSVVVANPIVPSFDRVYVLGNGAGWYDSINVTSSLVPEPASLGLLALGSGLMLLRRRSA